MKNFLAASIAGGRVVRGSGKLIMNGAKHIYCELKQEESFEDIHDEQFHRERGWLENVT